MSELFNLQISDKSVPVLEAVKHFIATEITPVEQRYHDAANLDDIWCLSEQQ